MKQRILFVIITLIIVAFVIMFPHEMLSPGNLYQAHSDIENNCFACHKVISGTPNENCISCHKPSEIGLKKDKKGNFVREKNKSLFHEKVGHQSCISCHTDHKESVMGRSSVKFEHSLLPEIYKNNCISCHSKPNNNLHSSVSNSCVGCHSTINWTSKIEFNHNLIQKTARGKCINCHKIPMDNFHSSTTSNCALCHGFNKWNPSTFSHDLSFQLDENHKIDCKVCHTTNNFREYTCFGCHEHSIGNIREEHSEEGITNFTNCVKCHKNGSGDEVESNEGKVRSYISKELNNENEENDD
ncbi:cytochrome c3 family protein [Flavobacterium taihuense]|uniref:Class III cytochrome C domain-containing protein n=1 Tax=Flavobacterium taihuense TaxID=2857508 RepID=A0ABS6XUV8_9FLAO|nr:cytochrome c3 family protein [Flavobacterium taihuense]MBW4360441.1 hypothetical protein [Flavobacterium taihuense]